MAHESNLTESQVRHVDQWRHADGEITFEDLEFESEARHVDEFRHAKLHEEESP